jgi:cardiolipin synthase C
MAEDDETNARLPTGFGFWASCQEGCCEAEAGHGAPVKHRNKAARVIGKAARGIGLILGGVSVFVLAMRMSFPLPEQASAAVAPQSADKTASGFAGLVAAEAALHPGLSGIALLQNGADAFAARIHLARAATQSIDAQYYIWKDDLTGLRLLTELQDAAKRGVRVRLLVDDNGTTGLDQELAALDALPSAEVRIFNPFTLRNFRRLNYTFDFFRLNRRMHNKSFTVDGAIAIVGGRNIGDIYFETGGALSYIDLDVLAAGPAAEDVGAEFARYWDSRAAYPVASLIALLPGSSSQLEQRDAALRDTPEGRRYAEYVHSSAFSDALMAMSLPMEWVPALLFSDDPGKVLGLDSQDDLMIQRLFAEIGTPQSSLDILSAYFVPGSTATALLGSYAGQGIRVRTLTNALEATDVAIVHGAYSAYRPDLLAGGVEVFELKSDGGQRQSVREVELFDLSKAALHAKGFSIDRKRIFIGSLNFDPRSRRLNTEMGLLIDSTKIAGGVSAWLDDNLVTLAYQVSLGPEQGLVWTGQDRAGKQQRYEVEPNTTLPLRILIRFLGFLPIQWLL